MRRAPSSGRSTPAGPSKRGKSPDGAGSLRQLSAIAAATYFLIVALIGSASSPYSRRWMSRLERSPAKERSRASTCRTSPSPREHKAQHQRREGDEDRDDQSDMVLRLACSMSSPSRSCRYIPKPDAQSRRTKMIRTRRPPCAIREGSVFLLAPFIAHRETAIRALNRHSPNDGLIATEAAHIARL